MTSCLTVSLSSPGKVNVVKHTHTSLRHSQLHPKICIAVGNVKRERQLSPFFSWANIIQIAQESRARAAAREELKRVECGGAA